MRSSCRGYHNVSVTRSPIRHFRVTWAMPEQLECVLWPVVRAAADLLTLPDAGVCGCVRGLSCGWMYVDRSRNGMRRWCEWRRAEPWRSCGGERNDGMSSTSGWRADRGCCGQSRLPSAERRLRRADYDRTFLASHARKTCKADDATLPVGFELGGGFPGG